MAGVELNNGTGGTSHGKGKVAADGNGQDPLRAARTRFHEHPTEIQADG